MKKTYTKGVNIKSDLTGGDISIQNQLDTASNSNYNLIPTAVMICKNTTTATVEPLKCRLRGGADNLTFYLKINEIYELAVDKVYSVGSSAEDIFLLGDIN
jgi:hypothetical protein